MAIKKALFKIRGMSRDLSASAFNPQYAYDNRNIRILATDNNTQLSITNEKGTKPVTIEGITKLEGKPIGKAVLNNELVLFTTDNKGKDNIYKIWIENNVLKGTTLFNKSSLGFNSNHPIETLSFYENNDIRKVYWTDGLNPPRFINIAASKVDMDKWTSNSFDFVPTLKLEEEVKIERNLTANGIFSPGVIQYAFTYFNKYGRESNIFYTSPLFYISYNNRGASPEDKVGNSFNINISNVDNSFDYVRVYSILRTSINATPECKRVVDLAPTLNSDTSKYEVKYTDNGTTGDIIDPTELLYVGGEEVVFGTMTQKDNTLFLGDISLKRKTISKEIKDSLYNSSGIRFIESSLFDSPKPKGFYPYENQLKRNSNEIKTFKYLETYRLGVQFQHYTGKWSEPIWLNDVRNTTHVSTSFVKQDSIKLVEAIFSMTGNPIIGKLKQDGFIKARPVIVFPSLTDRECVCQGILCPTVYNVKDRFDNSPFVQSSWFTRPNAPFDIKKSAGTKLFIFRMVSVPISTQIDTSYKVHVGELVVELPVYGKVLNKDKTEVLNVILYNTTAGGMEVVMPDFIGDLTAVTPGLENLNYSGVEDSVHVDMQDLDNPFNMEASINSRGGILTMGSIISTKAEKEVNSNEKIDLVNKGAWTEFRHNYPIPSNDERNAEIQCIYKPPLSPIILEDIKNNKIAEYVSDNSENFYVDKSIITLHSPDIEFDDNVKNIDTSNLKLRIVGMVPLTSFVGDIDIQTSTPPNNYVGKDGITSDLAPGFYKEPISSENISHFGFRGLMSGAFWFDDLTEYKKNTGNPNKLATGFIVYPWHRNGSLNNQKASKDGYLSAKLDKKKLSNLRYSYNSYYLDTIWNAEEKNSNTNTGISGVSIFDSNEMSLIRIPSPKNSNLPDINYYGNVDKVLTVSRVGIKKDGYPIITTGAQNPETNAHKLFSGGYMKLSDRFTEQNTGTDPIRIKYKSTPHAVMALNYDNNKYIRILPTLKDGDPSGIASYNTWTINDENSNINDSSKLFWEKDKYSKGYRQDIINANFSLTHISTSTSYGPEYGWLWLGEIYNDNVQNRFGGQTEEAFENNLWLPAGEPVSLDSPSVVLRWTEGDTYYQRYDHIKTYPFTLQDQNSITDIVSFMCETRVNLDGRYDKNRGQTSNFAITPENFNKLNEVYSQDNNFFNYRSLNYNKLYLDNFHNSITWTKTKTAGELTDTWTNITLANTLDLDGDKGDVRALRRFNNNIIAFQDRGISQILYNENVQINAADGIPIEIANSGKVQGKRYLSEKIGCVNKWSIAEAPGGLYFIDDNNKDIYLFNGQINNISDKFGFHSWINNKSNMNIWNPNTFSNAVSYYDNISGDIFFIYNDECLAFSEPLGAFSSFYNYEHIPYFINLDNKGLWFNYTTETKAWLHNEGDYNMFFGNYKPFYTTVICNPDPTLDKIFNNVEFRSDSWNKDGELVEDTFDKLYAKNEYQEGVNELSNTLDRPSALKKKFRIYRANVPRDNKNHRDRIRNPWAYITLAKEKENTNKTILHDIVVDYFE